MTKKRTMTLNLTEPEMQALEDLTSCHETWAPIVRDVVPWAIGRGDPVRAWGSD